MGKIQIVPNARFWTHKSNMQSPPTLVQHTKSLWIDNCRPYKSLQQKSAVKQGILCSIVVNFT